jgi:Uma2 family endonuclease
MTWLEVCENKSLQDLPFKIETNRWGQIIMSPARWEHGMYQSGMVKLLSQHLPLWTTFVECPIETPEGVKVPDVAACSPEFFKRIWKEITLSQAPEICVEVLSDSNTEAEMAEKKILYFEKGAKEVWICSESGEVTFHTRTGQQDQSILCPEFPHSIGPTS